MVRAARPTFFDRIGLGLWRIEVEPREPQATDLFLHVLQATDAGVVEMAKVELIEQTGATGAKIVTPNVEATVTFATAGPVRGQIRIVQGAETYDADLTTDVADTYDAWRDDPRYDRWLTDPYLKATLTPSP